MGRALHRGARRMLQPAATSGDHNRHSRSSTATVRTWNVLFGAQLRALPHRQQHGGGVRLEPSDCLGPPRLQWWLGGVGAWVGGGGCSGARGGCVCNPVLVLASKARSLLQGTHPPTYHPPRGPHPPAPLCPPQCPPARRPAAAHPPHPLRVCLIGGEEGDGMLRARKASVCQPAKQCKGQA